MTHEDMERSMGFVLQQQAQSDQRRAEFQRSLALLQLQAKTSAEVAQLATFGGELAKGQVRLQNNLADLAESHKQLADSHRSLAEAQKKTEEMLKALIATLNRRFGGNGRGRKSA